MCRDAERNLLTDEREIIERWKCYYEGHLNGAEAGEAGASGRTRQPPQQQHSSNNSDSIGADDEMPLPSLDEIASVIKQLKSNTGFLMIYWLVPINFWWVPIFFWCAPMIFWPFSRIVWSNCIDIQSENLFIYLFI